LSACDSQSSSHASGTAAFLLILQIVGWGGVGGKLLRGRMEVEVGLGFSAAFAANVGSSRHRKGLSFTTFRNRLELDFKHLHTTRTKIILP
jgi:hypothetical protein